MTTPVQHLLTCTVLRFKGHGRNKTRLDDPRRQQALANETGSPAWQAGSRPCAGPTQRLAYLMRPVL